MKTEVLMIQAEKKAWNEGEGCSGRTSLLKDQK